MCGKRARAEHNTAKLWAQVEPKQTSGASGIKAAFAEGQKKTPNPESIRGRPVAGSQHRTSN